MRIVFTLIFVKRLNVAQVRQNNARPPKLYMLLILPSF